MNQAHGLWHEALDAYQDPELFLTRLNALLVSLRSVTFVLQKDLRHEDGFDEWYEEQRVQMRADSVMRWLHDARNKVEKQGDLAVSSVALLSIEGPWHTSEAKVISVEPWQNSSKIARGINVRGLSQPSAPGGRLSRRAALDAAGAHGRRSSMWSPRASPRSPAQSQGRTSS